MKWGRKKHTCESSVGRSSSLISHVLPNSWLLKFKQKSRDVEAKPVKVKRKGKSGLASGDSPKLGTAAVGAGEERFYGGEGDGFWRLSFGEEGVEGNSSNGNMRSFWYDSDNELEAPPSSCHSFRTYARSVIGEADIHKFNNLSLDARKMQGFHGDEKILPEIDEIRRDEKLKEINRRSLEERWPDLERNSYEADEIEHFRRISMMERKHWKLIDAGINKHGKTSFKNSRNYNLTTIEEDGSHGISAEKRSSDWEKLKEMKIKEIKSRSEDHRKSVYVSRESQRRTKQNSRVKVSSPRIKALEDMKKAKIKMKKGKEKTREGGTRMESFAVVKCSFDPQKDFRESMIEMIMEKQIRRPEQLEELLACYLTLNSDEYHDLIIKVFRQVWFDLNHSCFNKEI